MWTKKDEIIDKRKIWDEGNARPGSALSGWLVLVKDVAARQGISERYLEHLFLSLKLPV